VGAQLQRNGKAQQEGTMTKKGTRISRVMTVTLPVLLSVSAGATAGTFPPGFDRGGPIVWAEGERQDVFERSSSNACPGGPADAAPDKDTWLTVDIPLLDHTKAKAAIVFGHAWAEQDGVGESNGVTVHMSREGSTGPSPWNQVAQTKVKLANDGGDEHSMMIVDLDEQKNFKALYHFGEMFETEVDETQLCWWGARIQLLGWIEQGKRPRGQSESAYEREDEKN
jgi:hypothetical protein